MHAVYGQWGSMTNSVGRGFHNSNMEIGVLLTTTSNEERDKWLARFPLHLPIDDQWANRLRYKLGTLYMADRL